MEKKKPLFTGANVNKMAGTLLGQGGMAEQAKKAKKGKAKKDWRAFVQDEFQLSGPQKENLSNIPGQQVQRIQKALNDAADRGGQIELELGSETGGSGELVVTIPQSGGTAGEAAFAAAAAAPEGGTVKATWTFDADCTGWEGPKVSVGGTSPPTPPPHPDPSHEEHEPF
jgi:hypothetical protein